MASETTWYVLSLHSNVACSRADFARVRALLAALEDPVKRSAEVYVQGNWERGGYLKGTTPTSGEN